MINYKTILPSSLLQERQPVDMNFNKKVNENMTLKLGTVVDIVEVGDTKNQSGFMVEYNVLVVEDDNTSIYKNCIAVDSFGGLADYMQVKRRVPKDPKKVKDKGSLKKQEGSIVLMLCLEGSAEQAIIIGALPHPDKGVVLSKDKGHHLEGEFNGINWIIDNTGALTITFKSATTSDGKPTKTASGGSQIKMENTGAIELNSGSGDSVRLDKSSKSILAKAGDKISLESVGDSSLKVGANLAINTTADLIANAQGNATLMAASKFMIEAGALLEVKAASTKITIEDSLNLKANNIFIEGTQINVGKNGSPAVIQTTQFMGIGNLGLPVISTAIGPFSNSVFIGN